MPDFISQVSSDISAVERGVDSLASQIGNAAAQVQGFAQQTHLAVNTPIAITLPTTQTAGSVGLGGLPNGWLFWGVVGLVVLKVVL